LPFADPAHSTILALSLHDALPIFDLVLDHLGELVEQLVQGDEVRPADVPVRELHLGTQVDCIGEPLVEQPDHFAAGGGGKVVARDRKSTRLNSSHVKISYAVVCLK